MNILLMLGAVVFICLMIYVAYLAHRKFGEKIKILLDIVALTRISTLIILFGALLLLLNDQGRDLAVGLGDNYLKGLVFLTAVGLWATQSWYWSRVILDREYGPTEQFPFFQRLIIQHMPRMLGALAFAFAIIALWQAKNSTLGNVYFVIACIMAIAFYFLVVYRRKLQKRVCTLMQSEFAVFEQALFKIMTILSILTITIFSIWAYAAPVNMGFTLGAGTVFFIAMSSLVPVGTVMVAATGRHKFPIVTSLVFIAIAFSCINDNHAIRSLDHAANQSSPEHAFEDWLVQGSGSERQIVVVATAGGGIRAAYWTTTVLGAIQDQYPKFRNKLFAISGVSGGSVGGTVFTTLLNQDNNFCNNQHCYQNLGQKVLARDFLGPTVTALLYPDFMQRLLPLAVLPDRAKILEASWEDSWHKTLSSQTSSLSSGFTELYSTSTAKNQWLPLLLLNATHQETGSRIITSPIHIESSIFADAIDFYKTHTCDIRASTAAHNSARFSYVSPAGRITAGNCDSQSQLAHFENTHLVDGGYFENYGAATARELLQWLMEHAENQGITLKPIVIQISNDVNIPLDSLSDSHKKIADPARFANETRAPITTMFNTRTARGQMEFVNLYRWTQQLAEQNDACFFHFRFYQDPEHEPALGWVLSEHSQQWIDDHLHKQNQHTYKAVVETLRGESCQL